MDDFDKRIILVQTDHLDVHFPLKKESPFSKRRYIQAVSDVSLKIYQGETFGLVGESGCGKSTFADTTLGFIQPTSGSVIFDGDELDRKNKSAFNKQRRRMQKIFQNPASSFNPRFTVLEAISEPMKIRGGYSAFERREKTEQMLEGVGLSASDCNRNVMEFSGGQQQRIAIARALILNPDYIVCDEPVSALDVSVHAQILNLLMDLQQKREMTYLFISHNLAAMRKLCNRIAILYMGKVVEYGDCKKIFKNPCHPYTRALIDAVPRMDGEIAMATLKGDVTKPLDSFQGCHFAPRCPYSRSECKLYSCRLKEAEKDHFVACLNYSDRS